MQSQQWPVNPVDLIISKLESEKDVLKNATTGLLTIADLGCGDAKIASHFAGNAEFSVGSYDLVKVNAFVTSCDISKVPASGASCDVAVFCLSLMGINYFDFLQEAFRLLRKEQDYLS